MNVFRLWTIVTKTQTATTLMDPSCAPVTLDTLGVGLFATVNLRSNLLIRRHDLPKLDVELECLLYILRY
jgi:hypothetical protein